MIQNRNATPTKRRTLVFNPNPLAFPFGIQGLAIAVFKIRVNRLDGFVGCGETYRPYSWHGLGDQVGVFREIEMPCD